MPRVTFIDPDGTRRCLDGLAAAARQVERPAELGELEISITPPPGPLDPDAVSRYADLGVHRLIPFPLHRSGIAVEGEVRAIGDKLVR